VVTAADAIEYVVRVFTIVQDADGQTVARVLVDRANPADLRS